MDRTSLKEIARNAVVSYTVGCFLIKQSQTAAVQSFLTSLLLKM